MMNQLSNNQQNYYLRPPSNQTTDNILFVADLPDETCEEDLFNFFKSYKFSSAKLFHNVMKTHAFVHFETAEFSERARLELNGVKITPKYATNKIGKPVRMCRYETKQSIDIGRGIEQHNSNLLVKNIPKEVSAHNFWNMFRKFGDIKSCKLVVDMMGNSKGYGYVNYYRGDDADKALNELNNKELCSKRLRVNLLMPGRHTEKRKNNIYVKHIPKNTFSNDDLKNLFVRYGEIKSAIVLKDNEGSSKGFGFVCFENPEKAEEAYKQMNGKTIYEGLPPLYVNFAMKKSERQEHLLKKREETFKMTQRMTIFAKIKDENSVKCELDFEQQIRQYLSFIFNKEYKPKNLKVRYENKNAFITMNSQRDTEEFIRKIQDYQKDNDINIFFNLYKSKVERISNSSYFKKFNNFDGSQGAAGSGGKYKNFNNFAQQVPQPTSEFPYSSINNPQQGRYKTFNQFEEPIVNANPMYAQYNNPIPQKKQEIDDEDEIGEFIYNFVERMYPNEAPKITGMILELGIGRLRIMISTQKGTEELTRIINQAFMQLRGK